MPHKLNFVEQLVGREITPFDVMFVLVIFVIVLYFLGYLK